MADIATYKIQVKSDFVLTIHGDAGWTTPFCIKFWTGAPSQAYFVGWDGTEYINCKVDETDASKLIVLFDDHQLPAGQLKMQMAWHTTIADFPKARFDEVMNQMSVVATVEGEEKHVELAFEGEADPEVEYYLPAYANEVQRIANEEQRIANEAQRIANEQARIAAEQTRQQQEQQRINQEQTRQENEAQRIRQEDARMEEYIALKEDAVAATTAANDAASLANAKAQLAQDKANLAQAAATLANQKAQLAADKAALANDAAQLANEKAALALQKAEYAQQQGGYAKDQGDYAKNQGDYAKEQGDTALADHQRAEADHVIAVDDHTQAGNDHTRADSDHGIAVDDHTQAGNDHTRAESDHGIAVDDHTQAGNDHTRAESDHGIAADDHTQAGNDHTRAESDHTRAESDHAAVELYVDSLGVFDLSKHNAVGGVLATYADLSAALTALNALDSKYKYGGMSFKFIRTDDNKYVQYFLTKNVWSASKADWEKMNLEDEISQLEQKLDDIVEYDESTIAPYATEKYIYWGYGAVWDMASATISGLIPLKAGQTIKVNIPQIVNTNTAAIGVHKPNGTDFYRETGARSQNGVTDYEYTATDDCQVAICFITAGGFTAQVIGDFITKKVEDLSDEVDTLSASIGAIENTADLAKDSLDGYVDVQIEIAQENKGIIYAYGTVTDANGFAYSKPIWMNKGDIIKMNIEGGANTFYAAITGLRYENIRYTVPCFVRQSDAVEYEWEATFSTFVVLCFPMSGVTVSIKRVPIPEHINRIDEKEPTIVAPFHNVPADGSAGSVFNAETVTALQLDAEAQRIQKNYSGMLSREVLGKDASGEYDVVQYVCTRRDYFAYKAADALFAWKSSGNTILYTKSFCPVPGDAVYDSAGSSVGLVSAYNSTNSTMTTGGVDYIRSKENNIAPDVVYLHWDLKEAYIAYNDWSFNVNNKSVVDRNKFKIGSYTNEDFNLDTEVLTFNSKPYHRAKSYDFGREEEHTIVLWGNEHAPQSDPAEPAITLLKMMEDLSSSVAETNPLLRYIKQHCKVIFVPCVNPWGMTTRIGTGRVNYNGVNLNRNYDYKWESVVGESKGNSAGDQPEVRYIMDSCAVFGADLAIDVHCLGYDNYINTVAYDCIFPEGGKDKIYFEMQRDYNKYFQSIAYTEGSPGEGSGFVYNNMGISGGLIEMNAGIPNETLHCAGIMQMDYDYLMKMIRLFLQISAPDLYITR